MYKIETSYACTSYYPDAACAAEELGDAVTLSRATFPGTYTDVTQGGGTRDRTLMTSTSHTPLLGGIPEVSADIELQRSTVDEYSFTSGSHPA